MKTRILKAGTLMIAAATMLTISCKKGPNGGSYLSAPTTSSQMSFAVNADNGTGTSTSGTNSLATNSTGSNNNNGTGASTSVNWTAGIANISGFKFEAKKRGVQIEITSKNMATVDLFAATPPSIGATIDTGTYSEIEVRIEFSQTNGTNLPLVIKGTFTPATGAAIPIEFDLNDNAEVRVESQNVVVDGKTDISTIVTMHLNKLLSNVSTTDLANATQTNGTIVISKTSNNNIYGRILNNLSSCGDSHGFDHHDR